MLISLLVTALILLVIWWGFHRIAGALGAPPIIVTIVDVVLVIAFCIYALGALGLVDRSGLF